MGNNQWTLCIKWSLPNFWLLLKVDTSPLNDSQWVSIVNVMDSMTKKIYVDGLACKDKRSSTGFGNIEDFAKIGAARVLFCVCVCVSEIDLWEDEKLARRKATRMTDGQIEGVQVAQIAILPIEVSDQICICFDPNTLLPRRRSPWGHNWVFRSSFFFKVAIFHTGGGNVWSIISLKSSFDF